jgi:hypothetical protein
LLILLEEILKNKKMRKIKFTFILVDLKKSYYSVNREKLFVTLE